MKRRRFRVRNLLLGWTAYWLALIAVGLSPAIAAVWRMSRDAHGKGSVNASVNDGVFTGNVLHNGVTTWTGSISVLALTMLVALPPLLMWAVFLFTTPRTIDQSETTLAGRGEATRLNVGDSGTEFFRASSSTSKRRTREGS